MGKYFQLGIWLYQSHVTLTQDLIDKLKEDIGARNTVELCGGYEDSKARETMALFVPSKALEHMLSEDLPGDIATEVRKFLKSRSSLLCLTHSPNGEKEEALIELPRDEIIKATKFSTNDYSRILQLVKKY